MGTKQETIKKQLEILEEAIGILNNLTEEQIKIFEECIKRDLDTSDEIIKELNRKRKINHKDLIEPFTI